jgi:hypothetical protein
MMLLIAKIKMSRFLFNAVVEVEMMIPGLEHMDCVWKLLLSYIAFLPEGNEELSKFAKKGWNDDTIDRQILDSFPQSKIGCSSSRRHDPLQ